MHCSQRSTCSWGLSTLREIPLDQTFWRHDLSVGPIVFQVQRSTIFQQDLCIAREYIDIAPNTSPRHPKYITPIIHHSPDGYSARMHARCPHLCKYTREYTSSNNAGKIRSVSLIYLAFIGNYSGVQPARVLFPRHTIKYFSLWSSGKFNLFLGTSWWKRGIARKHRWRVKFR